MDVLIEEAYPDATTEKVRQIINHLTAVVAQPRTLEGMISFPDKRFSKAMEMFDIDPSLFQALAMSDSNKDLAVGCCGLAMVVNPLK